MDSAYEQRVRERAYEIWVAAGMEDGAADLHWLSAEQSVMNEAGHASVKRAAKPGVAKKPSVKKAAVAIKPAKKTVNG